MAEVTEAKNRAQRFLQQQAMDHEDIDMDAVCGVFLQEMEAGLAGRDSSLAMLPTYIETEREVPRNEPVIVMDAGGTNFRVATVVFGSDGQPKIENRRLFEMPGLKRPVGKEDFFRTMAGYIEAVADSSGRIGFCFSYPIEMFPSKDGRVLFFSKEIQAPQVEGQMIGENFSLALSSLGKRDKKKIVLLNDTVATLLAGRADFSGRLYDSYIGFILGTGTNTSYIEQNRNIAKAKGLDPRGSQIINIESGGFRKGPRSRLDEEFDAAQRSPGVNVFEKMISGAYLGPICLWTAKAAAREGLFSRKAADAIQQVKEFSTKQLDDFLRRPQGAENPLAKVLAGASEADAVTLYHLMDRLVERAAKLTAVNLSAAAIKSGRGIDPRRPICIVAEGTTFYQMKSLKSRVEYYLKEYLENKQGIYCETINVEDATLIGAAIAGLTN